MQRQSLLGLAVWGLVSSGYVFEPPFVVEERVGAEPRTGVWTV